MPNGVQYILIQIATKTC